MYMKDEKNFPHIQLFFEIRVLHTNIVISMQNYFEFRCIFRRFITIFLYLSEINICHPKGTPFDFLECLNRQFEKSNCVQIAATIDLKHKNYKSIRKGKNHSNINYMKIILRNSYWYLKKNFLSLLHFYIFQFLILMVGLLIDD